ncbi:hypothetical protein [Gordonia terrae]|uniref:hypothetical protein n=1 Tax=Gordonia terrae TaxID=2055 RepID=UPI003F6D9B39
MDFTTITLNAAAKAMEDAVIPALAASGQRQAVEQAHLVWDAIRFARDRVDLIGERRRTEALDLIGLIGRLADLDVAHEVGTADRLHRIHDESLAVVADPETTAERYAALIRELGDELTSMLEVADRAGDQDRSTIERLVLDHALQRLELDRAWLLPMGFDPEPSTVADLRTLLGQGVSAS